MNDTVILRIRDLCVDYRTPSGTLRALEHVDLDVRRGEILGVAGESGCGKSTLANAILRMIDRPNRISSGTIEFADMGNVVHMSARQLREYRWANVSMVFQSSQNALNPLLRIYDQARLVMRAHRTVTDAQVRRRAEELLRLVNLEPARVLNAYPHELSGGMKQRVGIMMALLLDPKLVILDEPTTALDVMSQASVLEILKTIHANLGTTMIFITHDMSVLAELAERLVVMYAGKVVEVGPIERLFYHPGHPYTQALMRATPSLAGDPRSLRAIAGQPPDLRRLPPGCRFAPRCPLAEDRCRITEPALRPVASGHLAACFLVEAHADGVAEEEVVPS